MFVCRSGDTLRVDAPAKLNLFLEVLERRPDGFHEIDQCAGQVACSVLDFGSDERRVVPASIGVEDEDHGHPETGSSRWAGWTGRGHFGGGHACGYNQQNPQHFGDSQDILRGLAKGHAEGIDE